MSITAWLYVLNHADKSNLETTSLSMGFQKPNNLQYRNLMDSHGASLLESDCPDEIYALVKLLHLIERIAGMQRMNSSGLFDLANDMNIQMFMNELQEWRAATPVEIRNLRTSPAIISKAKSSSAHIL